MRSLRADVQPVCAQNSSMHRCVAASAWSVSSTADSDTEKNTDGRCSDPSCGKPRRRRAHHARIVEATTAERPAALTRGPILLCAGTEPAAAARLAEAAASLLIDRPAVVLATWEPPPRQGSLDAVMRVLHDDHADLRADGRHAAARVARAACDALDAHGLDVRSRVCANGQSPWQVILEVGDEIDAGVIVAGTSEGSTPHAGALGGQARALAHRARRPLLLLPANASPAAPTLRRSSPTTAQLPLATPPVRRRSSCDRPAIVATVWLSVSHAVGVARLALLDEIAHAGAGRLDEVSQRQAEGEACDGAALLAAAGWSCETVALATPRNVTAAIIGAADEHGAAIVVTGTRGRSRIAAALLGSSTEGILRHAERPVLVVSPSD